MSVVKTMRLKISNSFKLHDRYTDLIGCRWIKTNINVHYIRQFVMFMYYFDVQVFLNN